MRTFLLLFLYVLIAVLALPVLLISALFRWLPPLIFIGRSAVRLGRIVLGVKLEVFGLERLDLQRSYIFMPNHLSLLDGPLMFVVVPRFMRVIVKRELFRIPILGQAMRVGEFVPVDRKGREGGKKAIQRAIRLQNEKDYPFLIFPEGTRSRDGRLQSFRRGGFYLAIESGTPIVPVSLSGSYQLMPKGAFFTKRGCIKVVFHDPVELEGFSTNNLSDLMDRVREAVAEGIDPAWDPFGCTGARA